MNIKTAYFKRHCLYKNILVTAMCLFAFPSSITSNTSSGDDTNLSVAPFTYGILFLSSCTLRLTLVTSSKSLICRKYKR